MGGPALQMDMFGGGDGALPEPYTPKVEHVRNRLVEMVETMRAAETWPWSSSRTKLFRETVWDYLLNLLPDQNEAARWRADLDEQAARLDRRAA